MLKVLLHLSTISVWIINFDGAKEKPAWQMLISPWRMELNSVLSPAWCVVKMTWISTSVLYQAFSMLYILTELSANDVKFISVDRQKLDLLKYIYLWYRKFYICWDTARFYEHKKWPSYVNSIFEIIFMGKRELFAVLNLSYWWLAIFVCIFLVVLRVCPQFVFVVFSDHTHLLFFIYYSKILNEYDQEIPQSQTSDNPMALRGRATQPSRDTRETNLAKQPALSSPSRWLQY